MRMTHHEPLAEFCFTYYEPFMINSENSGIFSLDDSPLDVTILVMSGLSIMCVASAVDPLRAANRVCGRRLFSWRFVSADGEPAVTTCGLPINVAEAFDAAACGDVLVIIAGFDVVTQATPRLQAAIRRAATRARAIGGVEAGSWLLGRTGLLNGRSATTHWEDLEDFASAHPETDVRRERYVVDGPVFTTGGAAPTFDLMLQLVRARLGMAAALDVAGVFSHGEGGPSDEQPGVSAGWLYGNDPRMAAAIRLMEERIDKPLTTAAIARRINLSVRGLEKLFRISIGETPGAYYLRLRLSVARRMVTDTPIPFSDIADRTGFGSASAFSRSFSNAFGDPPSTVRRYHTRSSATAIP